MVSGLMLKSDLLLILVVHLLQRSHTLTLNLAFVRIAGNHLITDQAVQQITIRMEVMVVAYSMHCSLLLCQNHLHQLCALVLFHSIQIIGKQ